MPFVEIAQVGLGVARNMKAFTTAGLHQALANKTVQHIPDWRHADAQVSRNSVGLEPRTRCKSAVAQHLL